MDICSRNKKLTIRRPAILVALALLLCSCKSTPPESMVTPPAGSKPPATTQQSSQPMRGIWLATVSRLDWPPVSSVNISNPTSRARVQQQAMIDKLDHLQRLGINTVFFQVKPDGTALWPSKILPWSDLNTKPGTIRELNSTLSQQPASVYVQHRDWIRTSGDRFVLDPGIPEVQDWITSIVAEVVSRYPVDGVQFDDYFYTESPGSRLNDNETYRKYGGAFASKADWRRNNTQQLIAKVSHTIKSIKPGVEFGVSPAGVWRNRSHDPLGSDTRGAAAYDESYADTRRWVEQGLLDYIAPQIYWPFSRSAARYDVLAKWWADVVKPTRTRLYIGIAFYKVGEPSKIEPDWMINGGVPELKKQLDLNDAVPEISGTILFREDYLNKPQTQQAVSYLQSRWGS
ncbi:TPA: family 10 glycosylhydrolase [Escherichia coli]|nr:family 10 glycosylhydrolase [Escherichia coli]